MWARLSMFTPALMCCREVIKLILARFGFNFWQEVNILKVDPCLFSFCGPTYWQLGPKFAVPWTAGATWAAEHKGKKTLPFPAVDPDACIGCGTCVGGCAVSPTLWDLGDDGKAHFNEKRKEECIHCGHCVDSCPVSAVSISCLHVLCSQISMKE